MRGIDLDGSLFGEILDHADDVHIAMITCPYFWVGTIPPDIATCRNGCWEEPACHTDGPFPLPPDWPKERCITAAVNRAVLERGLV